MTKDQAHKLVDEAFAQGCDFALRFSFTLEAGGATGHVVFDHDSGSFSWITRDGQDDEDMPRRRTITQAVAEVRGVMSGAAVAGPINVDADGREVA